jgi:hypothetical protein
MSIVRYVFRITGLNPLLMHNPIGMKRSGGGLGGPKKIPTAGDEAEAGVYRMPNGTLFVPSIAFRSSIVGKGGGATRMRIGKFSAKAAGAAQGGNGK